ncbi:hypothetical protein Lal_00001627 [Lupinus albus]|nr:hypothetical protein Lal_00001627 [Lupinus albus]
MKKGTKRKTKHNDAESKPESEPNKKQPTKATTSRATKPNPSKPHSEPQFFEDKRNLEDLWRETFPVGTVLEFWLLFYLSGLIFWVQNAFEDGGVLHGKRVYLFGCTEPQLVWFKDESKIVCIPVVVAVVSPFPPSDKIGINSVQREAEEIIPMNQMKMDWVPYIPLENRKHFDVDISDLLYLNFSAFNRESQVDKLKSQIFILSCTQRRAALKHLKLDHFYKPFKEDELEQSTEVQIIFPSEPKPIFCEFDWELDELEEFTDKLIQEEGLSEDQKDAFKEFVKEKVREAKKANREAREARRKAIAEMSEETKAAFENMRFYKFYPVHSPDAPDVSNVKSPFINRYYGKAHEILFSYVQGSTH